MQARRMRRVDLPFHDLRPVAGKIDLDDADLGLRRRRPGRSLELRHLVPWPHIDPDEPAGFLRRVSLVPHLLGEAAFGRFGRHFEHVAVHVELPAVIEAAQSAFFVAPEYERGFAVWAIFPQDSDPAVGVAKGYKILAEQAQPDGRSVGFDKLLGESGWNPM